MLLVACALLACIALLRIFVLARQQTSYPEARASPCRTVIVLGSGGHTAEMLRLLSGLSLSHYSPRAYIVADSDAMSAEKAREFESSRGQRAEVRTVPRARRVLQSYASSVPTTLLAFTRSLPLAWKLRPELLLCNGPGTCLPLCLAVYLLRVLGLSSARVVYVESVCRVEQLSLTGRLLYRTADRLVVQWPQLKRRHPAAHYLGRVV